MQQDPKSLGGWSVTNLQTWLVIKWSGILGTAATSLLLPEALINFLKTAFNYSVPASDDLEGIKIDLIQSTIDYGLNEIPSATVQTVVGRRADQLKLVSAIHYLTKKLKLFLPASIWCQCEATDSSGIVDKWPVNPDGTAKPFRIFDGYIVGSGSRKTSQGIEFGCTLTHWLADLNFSSTLSRSSSPQNPGQLSFNPALAISPNAGARDANLFKAGTPMSQPGPLISPAILQDDFWGTQLLVNPAIPALNAVPGGLKQWLFEICKQDRINWSQIEFGFCQGVPPNPTNGKNTEAIAALQRFEPIDGKYTDAAPMRMDKRAGIENIASQISLQLGMQTPEVLYNTTIWDKLVGEFANELLFCVVPQVEKALIAPFNPGLRKPWVTIYANDYDYIDITHFIPRPLRGVGLFIGKEFSAGGFTGLNNSPTYATMGAYYENPNRRNGLVVWKHAPRWLSTVVLPFYYFAAGKNIPIANTFKADIGKEPDRKQPKQLIDESGSIWCDYARSLYTQEILRGRNGRISGRLRFDIAPGSIIRYEEPEENFVLLETNQVRSYNYAQVLRVSCVLNSEAQKAGTALQIAFVRDEDENLDASYSVDRHPIWSCNWYGAPLVNDDAFYPGGGTGIAPPDCNTKGLPVIDINLPNNTPPIPGLPEQGLA